jgi:hypothetical protein
VKKYAPECGFYGISVVTEHCVFRFLCYNDNIGVKTYPQSTRILRVAKADFYEFCRKNGIEKLRVSRKNTLFEKRRRAYCGRKTL